MEIKSCVDVRTIAHGLAVALFLLAALVDITYDVAEFHRDYVQGVWGIDCETQASTIAPSPPDGKHGGTTPLRLDRGITW